MNRRIFLKTSGLALVGSALTPDVFVRMAQAGTARGKKVFVAIFQRGAIDGLSVVVPHGEKAYFAARPNIAVRNSIDLDGFFGLHPAMGPLHPYFKDRALAFIHAAGSPDSTRSHFDAQDFMETGTPGVKSTRDGFLSRALETQKPKSPLRAVSVTPNLPRILAGKAGALAISDIASYGVRTEESAFAKMYGGAAFEAAKLLRGISATTSAQYPRGPLAQSLKQIAQLIRADVGLEVAFADVSGWDTHAGQGGSEGQLANNLSLFAQTIAAFAKDLGSRMNDVTLVTMSEFGRTVRENGNRGTDHGHGTVMMTMGGSIEGGKVHGKWPGLQSLYENRDLAVTTDFRDVFAEILTRDLGVTNLSAVFPAYKPERV